MSLLDVIKQSPELAANLTPEEQRALGLSVKPTQTKPAQPAPIKRFAHTDLGNSERLIDRFGGDILYCHELKKWFFWNGQRWKKDDENQIYHLAGLTVRGMVGEAQNLPGNERSELIRWSLKSEARDRIRAMVDLCSSNPTVVTSLNVFDNNPWLLNFENGTLDLKTGKLQEHDQTDFLTKISPIKFDPGATCPLWQSFISRIMGGNAGLIEYLQKAFGYSLTGSTKEQDIFIPFGTGANGKSTALNTVMALLGQDYAKQTSATALLTKQNETAGEEIAILAGSRFVATIEVDDGRRLAESLVKQLTGGDRVRARFLFSNSFEFLPTFKLWLATNHRPKVTGTDKGIWRRIKLIPFNVAIPENEQDRDLPEKLKEELPGILNWCVEGCLKWQREGLTPPTEVVFATDTYRAEMDTLLSFLADCCKLESDLKCTVKLLYESYREWCSSNGEQILSQRKFGAQLRERGFVTFSGTGNITYWRGVGVIAQDCAEPDRPIADKRPNNGNVIAYPGLNM